MGTRNLTIVQKDNEYKIAQYGQWDGYPEGQGITILKFLSNNDLELFKSKLDKCKFLTPYKEREIKNFYKSIGVTDGWCNMEQADKFKDKYPQLHRDMGGKILEFVNNSNGKTIWLRDSISFAGDSLFCEYAYVVDFDSNTLEVYKGFNESLLGENERFAKTPKEKEDSKYNPIKFWQAFSLSSLPTEKEFLEILTEKEDEE